MTELYEKHDEKASKLRAIEPVMASDASDLSEGEGMTTDGEGGELSRRKMAMIAH